LKNPGRETLPEKKKGGGDKVYKNGQNRHKDLAGALVGHLRKQKMLYRIKKKE